MDLSAWSSEEWALAVAILALAVSIAFGLVSDRRSRHANRTSDDSLALSQAALAEARAATDLARSADARAKEDEERQRAARRNTVEFGIMSVAGKLFAQFHRETRVSEAIPAVMLSNPSLRLIAPHVSADQQMAVMDELTIELPSGPTRSQTAKFPVKHRDGSPATVWSVAHLLKRLGVENLRDATLVPYITDDQDGEYEGLPFPNDRSTWQSALDELTKRE